MQAAFVGVTLRVPPAPVILCKRSKALSATTSFPIPSDCAPLGPHAPVVVSESCAGNEFRERDGASCRRKRERGARF